jgi:hypothetical protein
MVARLLMAREGNDTRPNISMVIDYLCEEYRDRVMSEGDPTLLEEAATWLAKQRVPA